MSFSQVDAVCFRISLHDMDMFSAEMISTVKTVLLHETGFDHFLFRVVFDHYTYKDFYIPVNPDRDYMLKGYDNNLELSKVLELLQEHYKKEVVAH